MLSIIMTMKDMDEICIPSIESILNQTYTDFELIIAIDGGEKKIDICDSRIKIVRSSTNLLPQRITNFAYKYTTGDYITVHDYDDISVPNRFEILFREIGNDLAISSNILVKRKDKEFVKKFRPDNFSFIERKEVKASAHHCATIVHRKLWDIIGPYNNTRSLAADSERMIKMCIYLLLSNTPLKMLDEPMFQWTRRPDSYSLSRRRLGRMQGVTRNILKKT